MACAIITATNGGAAQRKNVAGNPVTLQCECGSERWDILGLDVDVDEDDDDDDDDELGKLQMI